jgi:hypothetical protein
MPLLCEIYGAGYLNALSSLAEQSDQLRDMVEHSLFASFTSNVKKSPLCVWFDCKPYIDQPLFFWKEVLRDICHSMGTNMIREKSIKQLLTWFKPEKKYIQSLHYQQKQQRGALIRQQQSGSNKRQKIHHHTSSTSNKTLNNTSNNTLDDDSDAKTGGSSSNTTRSGSSGSNDLNDLKRKSKYPRNGWPNLKKGNISFLNNGTLYIFTSLFTETLQQPLSSSTSSSSSTSFAIEVNGESIQIGCWSIKAKHLFPEIIHEDRLSMKLTMDDVLSGTFEYFVQLRTNQTLCLGQVKSKHPASNLDPKFRKMIPFVTTLGKPGQSGRDILLSFELQNGIV